jgi:hypothetical protein
MMTVGTTALPGMASFSGTLDEHLAALRASKPSGIVT